ncbi:MAG: type II secretion system F family protein [Planctomycetota bacterium]|jgi:type IV pilus assembly protein PilC
MTTRIGLDELTFFNRQLASMARLDLPFPQGLRALSNEIEGKEFKVLVQKIVSDLEEGLTLSESLTQHGGVFDDLYLGIVRAGEESGDLAGGLEGLANYSESMLFLRQRVRATLAYPTVALILAMGMISFIFSSLVPKFGTIFASLDIQVPPMTRFYLGLAQIINEHAGLLLGGLVAGVVGFIMLRRSGAGRRALRRFALNLPFYGRLLRQVLLLRFCETLQALLRSNISLVPALNLTASTLGDNVLRLTVLDMRAAAEEGRRVSDVLRRNSLFPRTFVWKFSMAEEQGTLENTLGELSRYLEMELKAITARFSSLLEPFLIAIVGVVVGSMVLSVFLPIFRLHGGL